MPNFPSLFKSAPVFPPVTEHPPGNHSSTNTTPFVSPTNMPNPPPQNTTTDTIDKAATQYYITLIPHGITKNEGERRKLNNTKIKIGRYQGSAENEEENAILYKSTVVSRKHAILFMDKENVVYIQDTKSLGGTFVNNTRLSTSGKESKPFKLRHGDILQFGIDYRSSATSMEVAREKDKCITVRVELEPHVEEPRPPRWYLPPYTGQKPPAISCCICLSTLRKKQALLVAPCGHMYHYKCIGPLLGKVVFACPLCRESADLQASVESIEDESDSEDEAKSEDQEEIFDENNTSKGKEKLPPIVDHPQTDIFVSRAAAEESIVEEPEEDTLDRGKRPRTLIAPACRGSMTSPTRNPPSVLHVHHMHHHIQHPDGARNFLDRADVYRMEMQAVGAAIEDLGGGTTSSVNGGPWSQRSQETRPIRLGSFRDVSQAQDETFNPSPGKTLNNRQTKANIPDPFTCSVASGLNSIPANGTTSLLAGRHTYHYQYVYVNAENTDNQPSNANSGHFEPEPDAANAAQDVAAPKAADSIDSVELGRAATLPSNMLRPNIRIEMGSNGTSNLDSPLPTITQVATPTEQIQHQDTVASERIENLQPRSAEVEMSSSDDEEQEEGNTSDEESSHTPEAE